MSTYFPSHEANRMKGEGCVSDAREYFFSGKNSILKLLIEQRFSWMNDYIGENDAKIIEIGSGPGLSKEYIQSNKLVLTDILDNDWIDMHVDALDLPFEDNSLDVVICSHMIHHVAHPAVFLASIYKKLNSGGRLIIQDIYTGAILKFVLRLMRHEGWSDEVDVFNENEVCNDLSDPWSANCSIPKLLFFRGRKKFDREFPMYNVKKIERNECFLFLCSGGVIAKSFTLPIGSKGAKIIQTMDRFLVRLFPEVFACGCSIVLEKR